MIAFPCPKCRFTLKAPEEKAGAATQCPKCGCPVQVPGRPASIPPVVPDVLPVKGQAAAAPRQWHYSRDGQRFGPLAETEINQAIGRGELRPHDPVWRQGMPGWEPASKHFTFPQAPAAPSSPPPSTQAPQKPAPATSQGSSGVPFEFDHPSSAERPDRLPEVRDSGIGDAPHSSSTRAVPRQTERGHALRQEAFGAGDGVVCDCLSGGRT